ncbi:MAG: hypothetical protein WB502_14180 [Thermoactinomyces sp.]
MKGFVLRMLAAVAVSAWLAFLVSVFPDLSASGTDSAELPVFKNQSAIKVSREYLVDFILSQEIHMPLKRIDFYDHKIFLELDAGGLNRQSAERELVRIICRILEQTANVAEVQVLVHYKSGQSLLVEAKETDLRKIDPGLLKALSDREILQKVFKSTVFSFSLR